mmetsp:Transcript_33052/g.64859  ORF Transcript_33052/g.64859 Transcript_33052/m.64859 type:complete len:109 (+) Transcript_33052:538-864(+)
MCVVRAEVPFEVDDDELSAELLQHFNAFGAVVDVEVLADETGFTLVTFESAEAAKLCVEAGDATINSACVRVSLHHQHPQAEGEGEGEGGVGEREEGGGVGEREGGGG